MIEEGAEPPPGYRFWSCPVCTANCNFEAMNLCRGDSCPHDIERPDSVDGFFEFIVPDTNEGNVHGGRNARGT